MLIEQYFENVILHFKKKFYNPMILKSDSVVLFKS